MTTEAVATETYTGMKNRHQAEFDAFPMGYAFGEEQFRDMLEKLECGEDDIAPVGPGAYCRLEDVHSLRAMLDRQAAELNAALKDPGFAFGAFLYEMDNHEYAINWQGDWDVFDCFGNVQYGPDKGPDEYADELGWPYEMRKAYKMARFEHMRNFGEW